MITIVMAATAMFFGAPKVGAVGTPPAAQRIATGSSAIPMTVITTPVTTSGKKRSSRVKNGAISMASRPATSSAPKTARRPATPPPSARPTAKIVDTAANEVPCTMGCRAPNFHTPMVCSKVARPEMNRPADTR